MKKTSLITAAFVGAMALTLAGCKGATDNSNVPLTLSSMEVDGVFNPFFSTSAPDSNILSMTQISMLTNDKNGNVACGDNEAVVVLDYDINTYGTGEEQTTTYDFVLKNNIKFSDGVPLTIKDVLFNLYVYLDPVYTGSSTIYSTDIVGLKEYRTQTADKNEQDAYMQQFMDLAEIRIDNLSVEADAIFENATGSLTEAEFLEQLGEVDSANTGSSLVKDYKLTKDLFIKELNTDYNQSKDTAKDIIITDSKGTKKKGLIKNDTEAFLYNLGYIHLNEDDKLVCDLEELRVVSAWSQDLAVKAVLNDMLPKNVTQIVYGWNTANELFDTLTVEELTKANEGKELAFPNISGIKFANMDNSVTVNGKSYPKVEYKEDGSASTNEVLSITIHKVDPKAIWNFGFPVAPLHYYSDQKHVDEFSIKDNKFGVQYANQDFMTNVLKDSKKTGVPMGAGPYIASNAKRETTGVQPGDFHEFGMVYFEANPNFLLGKPKIQTLRYKVIAQSGLMNSLRTGEIDFIQPNANPETIKDLNSMKSKGFENKQIQTSGYGYIGINASKIPNRFVRMVIMHAIDTKSCVDFYQGSAEQVNRSLSKSSWAYPEGATPYYPFIGGEVPANLNVVNPLYADFVTRNNIAAGTVMTKAQQSEFIRYMLEDATVEAGVDGFTKDANGVYVSDGGHKCKYTFTIAGSETDHPAWQALFGAGELLNENGFDVIVVNDQQALSKLNSGALTVWAAAWGSTIDPDLYQIYHMDSKATSVNNWGYKAILRNTGGEYDYEKTVVEELSDLIDKGRSTVVQLERQQIYANALDKIMELAVELPTYQRDDLFAYNANKINKNSLVPDKELSPFNGLLSQIWNVTLVS